MVSVTKPTKKISDKVVKVNKVVKHKKKSKTSAVVIETLKKPAIEAKIKKDVTEKAKKKKKFVYPSKAVTDKIVTTSLNALQKIATAPKKQKILEDELQIFAEIHCIKIQTKPGNVKFILPHCTAAPTGEICLIVPDMKKGRRIDHEPTIEHWEELLKKAGVTEIKTILPLRQIKVEYDQFELKRRLLTQHDFIMVDTRILSHVSHLLGNMFFKKHNMLVPVRLNEKNVKKSIETGLRSVMLRLSEGETSTIVVGHTNMPQDLVKENVICLVDQLKTRYPGGEANVRRINLKLPKSMSIPIYITLRSSSTIHVPKLKHKVPKSCSVVEDELSTLPGRKVKVTPDGAVYVKNIKQGDDSDYENEDMEGEDEDMKVSDNEESAVEAE